MVSRTIRPAPCQDDLCPSSYASYSEVESAGTAARPLEFPSPIVRRGNRIAANAIDPRTGQICHVKNIIVRERDDRCGIPSIPTRGYRIVKKLSDSAYGSVHLCVVMKRRHIFYGEFASHHQRSTNPCSLDSISEDGEFLTSSEDAMSRHWFVEDNIVWEPTDEYVAVKIISFERVNRYRGRHLEDPIKEIAALNLIGTSSPHVIGSIEIIQDDKFLYSIIPYCNGGDLYSHVMDEVASSDEGRICEAKARGYFIDILKGLNHIQKKGVVHRDLSLENIIIHDGRCVIVDLGMSLRVPFADLDNACGLTDASAGTMRRLIQAQGQGGRWTYMAPEIVSSEDQFDGYTIDLWAAGVVLFILLVGRSPFEMAVETDPYFNTFSSGGVKETLRHWEVPITDEACDLLQGMMWSDPTDRLNLAQVASHPWVAGRSTPSSSFRARPRESSIESTTRSTTPLKEPPKHSETTVDVANRTGDNVARKKITKILQQPRGILASKAMASAYHKSSQILRGIRI